MVKTSGGSSSNALSCIPIYTGVFLHLDTSSWILFLGHTGREMPNIRPTDQLWPLEEALYSAHMTLGSSSDPFGRWCQSITSQSIWAAKWCLGRSGTADRAVCINNWAVPFLENIFKICISSLRSFPVNEFVLISCHRLLNDVDFQPSSSTWQLFCPPYKTHLTPPH